MIFGVPYNNEEEIDKIKDITKDCETFFRIGDIISFEGDKKHE